MSLELGRLVRWLPIVAFVVVISIEARTPDLTFVPGADNDLLVRKLGHAAVYGLLAIMVRWALRADVASAWAAFVRGWALPLLITAAVAVADELWQQGSLGREGKLTDALTDLTGAVSALLVLRTWRYRSWQRGDPATKSVDGVAATDR